MKQSLVASLFISVLILGCSVLSGSEETEVEIRVRNSSPYTIENMRISTGGGDYTYETLQPGERSEYKLYDYSYSYFFVSLTIDTAAFAQVPIDYVGESRIKSGRYTYDLRVETFEDLPISFSGQLFKD